MHNKQKAREDKKKTKDKELKKQEPVEPDTPSKSSLKKNIKTFALFK